MRTHRFTRAVVMGAIFSIAAPGVSHAAHFLSAKLDFENRNGRTVFQLDPATGLPADPNDWPGDQIPIKPGKKHIYVGNGVYLDLEISAKADGFDYHYKYIDPYNETVKEYPFSFDNYDTVLKTEVKIDVINFDKTLFRLDDSNRFEPLFIPLNSNDPRLMDFSILARAVPEPANWAMMIAGFGLVGAAMRRRRASIRFV